MKTKAITTIMITLFLASMFTITLGVAPVTAKANRHVQENWFSPSFLFLYQAVCENLADYYGELVHIEFISVTNTWTNHVTRKGDVHQTSQLRGTVNIYRVEPYELIETRDFFCQETGIDKGMDNGDWSLVPNWYDMFLMDPTTPLPELLADLDHWSLEWKIQGLYLYKATIIDGLCVQCEHGNARLHHWVHP